MTSPYALLIALKTLAAVASIATLQGCEKYALDRQMAELCQKDGGLRIYETVVLPASDFSADGRPFPVDRQAANMPVSEARLGSNYRYVRRDEVVKAGVPLEGEGRLIRHVEEVHRERDTKVLGTAVTYGRSGGDFIVIDHFSTAACPIPRPQLLPAVFRNEEKSMKKISTTSGVEGIESGSLGVSPSTAVSQKR